MAQARRDPRRALPPGPSMPDLRLTLAIGDYLHTRELKTGAVRPEGIELTVLNHPFETIAYRFLATYEWEISEFSLATYCTLCAEGNSPMVALPVFPSRVFRHGAIFVRRDSPVSSAADLAGKRIGIPQWTQTAVTYVRGFLQHEAGVPLTSIDWVQAGVNDPGRQEMARFTLPAGYRLRSAPDRSLNDLLMAGDIDAMISARPPNVFLDGRARRLIPDYRAQELAYFRKTGIFPIMHVVVMRRETYDANRWIARNLVDAFERAKRACLPELTQNMTSFLPIAWGSDFFEETSRLLFPDGDSRSDPWPYGIARNRATLEPFLDFCHEQGVTNRRLALEEMFPKEVGVRLKI
jgi:4,5-dihydroxyphthalate decarboxylase